MSAWYAFLAGWVTLALCIAMAYLGGPEQGAKWTPEIMRNIGILTLIMTWPVILAQMITFTSDDDVVVVETDEDWTERTGVGETDPDLAYFQQSLMRGLRTPEEIDAEEESQK